MKGKIFRHSIISLSTVLFFSNGYGNEIRIGLFQKKLPQKVQVSANTGFVMFDGPTGEQITEKKAYDKISIEKKGSRVVIKGVNEKDISADWIKLKTKEENKYFIITTSALKGRRYQGTLEIQSRPNELLVINIIDENAYLYSVLNSEMPVSWPKEALKAQAVIIRNFVRRNLGRHALEGYDLCDITHCQVYKGKPEDNPKTKEAILETRGQVLTYQGKIIDAFYHSCCGGATSNSEDVWKGSEPIPYLRGQDDCNGSLDFCRQSPDYEWRFKIGKRELGDILTERLGQGEKLGAFWDLEIKERDPAERIKKIIVLFENKSFDISGEEFYLMLGKSVGWHRLKSTRFFIHKIKKGYYFTGRGLGHGVGLCQWGAKGRAEKGHNYKEILYHYFPNTDIETRDATSLH